MTAPEREPAPSPVLLRVLMDRLPGVTGPCLNCGGRGSWEVGTAADDAVLGAAPRVRCSSCGGTGEEPNGASRRAVYPDAPPLPPEETP